jgi:uncharacterized membrane protein YdfJ with MMPL/SSD domain
LCSITTVYFVALELPVISFTPSLMMSILIAMSIDYSLFLLSRYREELLKGSHTRQAIEGMLTHAGHVVLVSGLTLTVSFAGLIMFPVNMLSTSGLGCTITLLFALSVNFTLTPSLLFQFDSFFERCARSPSSLDDTRLPLLSTLDTKIPTNLSEAELKLGLTDGYTKSYWFRLARLLINPWFGIIIIAATVAFVIPFSFHCTHLPTSGSIGGVLPRGAPPTLAYNGILKNFGPGTLFPFRLIIVNNTAPEFILPPATSKELEGDCSPDDPINFDFRNTGDKVYDIMRNLTANLDKTDISDFQTVFTIEDKSSPFSPYAIYTCCNRGFYVSVTLYFLTNPFLMLLKLFSII